MEIVLGEPAHPADFSRVVNEGTHSSYRVLDTTALIPRLHRFYWANRADPRRWLSAALCTARIVVATSGQIQTRLGTNLQPMEEGERTFTLVEFMQRGESPDPRDPRIAIADAILNEALKTVLSLSVDPEKYLQVSPQSKSAKHYRNAIYRHMRKSGWCPSDLSMLFGRLNDSCLYYISHLERPNPTQTHNMVRIHDDDATTAHEDSKLCSTSTCALRLLSDDTYDTQHADGCNRDECYEMVADRDEVADILKGGSLPLVMSISEGDDSRTVSLVPFSPGSDLAYVAISHVWSDGLGNVQRAALPRCQMLRLSNLIRNLPGRAADIVLFWIDTIGCPPDAAHQDEVQNLAISMMRQTYEDATAVLVLDSGLGQQQIQYMDDTEILMRIVCSGWNGRLWTLQEGALAKTLIFRFADAMYDVDDGRKRLLQKTEDICLELCVKPIILQRLHEFRGFKVVAGEQDQMIIALSNALRFRATSVATDEPLCLGALLGLDVGVIVRAAPSERMSKLWGMLRSFPSFFLLFPFPRLDAHGYAWAPRTFLLRDIQKAGSKSAGMRMDLAFTSGTIIAPLDIRPEGLFVRRPGFVFKIGSRSVSEQFSIHDETGKSWCLQAFLGESDHSRRYRGGRFFRFSPFDVSGTEEIAVLHTMLPHETAMALRGVGINWSFMNLVCIFGEKDDVIYARRVCGAICQEYLGAPAQATFLSYDHPTVGEIGVFPAVSRAEHQAWCLV